MRQHVGTHTDNNFIRGWYLDDDKLCDSLVDYFDSNFDIFLNTEK